MCCHYEVEYTHKTRPLDLDLAMEQPSTEQHNPTKQHSINIVNGDSLALGNLIFQIKSWNETLAFVFAIIISCGRE